MHNRILRIWFSSFGEGSLLYHYHFLNKVLFTKIQTKLFYWNGNRHFFVVITDHVGSTKEGKVSEVSVCLSMEGVHLIPVLPRGIRPFLVQPGG